jgi:HEAT repeat protein
MRAFLLILVLGATISAAQPSEKPSKTPLNLFEQQIASLAKDKTQDRERLIKAFVAGLKEKNEKLAAIDITDNRYVYLLSRDETNLLVGPLLRDKDDVVRWRALRSIGLNGLAGKHFETVTAMVKSATPEQLELVVLAMARSRDERFYPHLHQMLKHPDGMVRANAVFEMSNAMPRKALEPALTALWNDPHPQVRYDLTWLFSTDIAKLRERLKDPSPHVREAALRIIGETKRAEGSKDVAACCNDPEPHVRGQAAKSLGLLKSTAHLSTLVKLLEDRDVYPRRMAVMALDDFRDTKLAPIFVKMLRDSDSQVCEYSVQALRKLAAPEHAKAVLGLLNDESTGVRFAAAATLVRWTGAEHAKEIHRMVTAIRADSRRGGSLGDGHALIREMKSEDFLPTLELLAENGFLRDAAVEQQGMIREKKSVPAPLP